MSLLSPNPTTMAILTYRFPGVLLWFGKSTRSWWAVVWVSWGWRLVEAADVEELTRAIVQAETWPRPPVPGGDSEVTRWDCPVVVTGG